MRKYTLIALIALAVALVALTPTAAFANFSIHGGYSMDTDACAGCHRAHTAASSITWTNGAASGSALLNSTASEIYEFCYTCHDSVSLGAETDVESGQYGGTLYGTPGGMLNGGGFDSTSFSSQHMYTGSSWFAYGGSITPDLLGNLSDNTAPQIEMTCSTCHDVHGSSNYRLLKDLVNGRAVGGYDPTAPGYTETDPLPTPWVISTEVGYPTMGWLLHEPGATQVAGYQPDYTNPSYAKAPDFDGDTLPDADKGMSGWCASCHIQYIFESGASTDTVPAYTSYDPAAGYDSLDGWGPATRHRHPVNVPLSNFAGQRSLIVTSNPLPLAHDAADAATNDASDWIDCLTCHVAHGSAAVMTGYANVADSTDPLPDSGTGGIPPTGSSALLRMDNRGVCENCHNK